LRFILHHSFKTGLILAALLGGSQALAEELTNMLERAYQVNPSMRSALIAVQEADEGTASANALIRPSADATIGYTLNGDRTSTDGNTTNSVNNTLRGQVSGSQPLYTFGRFDAAMAQADAASASAVISFQSTMQNVLEDAADAYLDVIGARQEIRVNENNVRVLRQQLKATRDRFEVGELTRTDVALAQSELARVAESSLAVARASLAAAEAEYIRVSNQAPGDATLPEPLPFLPQSLDEAIAIGEANAVSIAAAEAAMRAAEEEIAGAEAAFNPRIDVLGDVTASQSHGRSRTTGRSSNGSDTNNLDASITARLTIPLYSGGSRFSDLRKAERKRARLKTDILSTKQQVRAQVASAWADLQSKKLTIQSSQVAVRASRLALDGIREEYNVGERTLVDLLDAEQDLLTSAVQLIQSEVGWYKAQFALASATGLLTPDNLKLNVRSFDFKSYREQVKNSWSDRNLPAAIKD
jgi:TolC family type I secretion outer membrane protein